MSDAFETLSKGLRDQNLMKASLTPSGFSPSRYVFIKSGVKPVVESVVVSNRSLGTGGGAVSITQSSLFGEVSRVAFSETSYVGVGGSSLLSGLVGYWKFDETGGLTAFDSHTGGNDGAANDARVFGTVGKIGNCADFTKGDDYIDLGLLGEGGNTSRLFSWNLWFKFASRAGTAFYTLFDSKSTSNNDNSIGIYGADSVYPGYLTVRVMGGTSWRATAYDDDSWHMVTVVKDGASTAKVYVDGVFADDVNVGSDDRNDGRRVGRGRHTAYDGLIDELGVWNRALSAGEVLTLFNNTNNKVSYPFDTSHVGTITAKFYSPINTGSTLTETGIFNQSTNGTMLARTIFPALTTSVEEEEQLTLTLTAQTVYPPLMDTARDNIIRWSLGQDITPPTHFGFGSSSVAITSSTHTAMHDENISRVSVSYRTLTEPTQVRFQSRMGESDGVGESFRLIGLLNSSTGGDLYGYFGIPLINKTQQFGVNTNFTIKIL
jgi:hypothetical protein